MRKPAVSFSLTRSAEIECLYFVRFLEALRIGTRLPFGGDLLRQPAYSGLPHKVIENLKRADVIMEKTFWVGFFSGHTEPMLEYVIASVHEALKHAPHRISGRRSYAQGDVSRLLL